MIKNQTKHGLLYYVSTYKELDNLLAYVSERQTDLEAIREYIANEYDTVELAKSEGREIDYDTIPQCIKEGKEVLKLQPFPWEWIRSSSNRYPFNKKYPWGVQPTSEEYQEWIKWLLDTLEEEAIKAGKYKHKRTE